MPTTEEPTAEASPEAPSGWRLRFGLVLIALSLVMPAFALLLPLLDLPTAAKATIAGVLVAGGPEVTTIAAVAVLGKSGFAWVKGRAFGFLKRHGPADVVSVGRYRVGLAMLLIPSLFTWVAWYFPDSLPGLPEYRVQVGILMDVTFFSSFFVLGGQFWDKLRSLFVRDAYAVFPEKKKEG